MPRPEPATVTTYRYVRISIVGVIVLLFAALLIQIAADGWNLLPSISAYYYSPVRSVLVGSLVAAAFLLVAVRGRPGLEDALLNLGGMLLPVVAFLPTPVEQGCASGARCVPDEFVPGVEVSMSALLLLGIPGLVFALWTLLTRSRPDRFAPSGFAVAVLIWAVVAVWFGPTADWGPRASLLEYGHYAAAVGVFAMIVAVAMVNARRTDRDARIGGRTMPFSRIYAAVASAMAVVLVGAGLAWAAGWMSGGTLVFWIEAALLALFSVFWLAQTAEFWTIGLPDEAVVQAQAPPV
jgi:hypothetical protein